MRRLARVALLLGGVFAATAADAEKPHILVILADDLGWRDVGYHGSEIATPNIDRLAREGVELDRFYVQPSCSPTRTGLMTGKSPLRLGILRPISKNESRGLPLDEKLLPQYLADAGYQPLMVGKWHLGHYTPDMFPQARGFEHFYGHVTGGIGYWVSRSGDTQREASMALASVQQHLAEPAVVLHRREQASASGQELEAVVERARAGLVGDRQLAAGLRVLLRRGELSVRRVMCRWGLRGRHVRRRSLR